MFFLYRLVKHNRKQANLWKLLISTLYLLFCLPAQAQLENYILDTGDLIQISIYGEGDLSFQVKLDDTGTITFPFLGNIQISGHSTADIEKLLASELISKEYLIKPEVTVSILGYRPFYIDGEVVRPGSYPFEPGLTLRKAITTAGGLTERASRSKISIIRDAKNTEPEDELLETPIKPDDIITVDQRFF